MPFLHTRVYKKPYNSNIQPWENRDKWARNLPHRHRMDYIDHNQKQVHHVKYVHRQIEFYEPKSSNKSIKIFMHLLNFIFTSSATVLGGASSSNLEAN